MEKNDNLKIPHPAVWTIKDILIVGLFVLIVPAIFDWSLLCLLGDTKTEAHLARYVYAVLNIAVPIFWIKKKYGFNKEIFGLQKGNLNAWAIIAIGIGTAIIYYLVVISNIISFVNFIPTIKVSYVDVLLAPISINGFLLIILAPIGEEIVFRGFMYDYLRKRMGLFSGLFVQAIIFAVCHLNLLLYPNASYFIINVFLSGLIFGLLYEKTGSLYTSIICHSCINYIDLIINVRIS